MQRPVSCQNHQEDLRVAMFGKRTGGLLSGIGAALADASPNEDPAAVAQFEQMLAAGMERQRAMHWDMVARARARMAEAGPRVKLGGQPRMFGAARMAF